MFRSLRRFAWVASSSAVGLTICEVVYVRLSFRLPPDPRGPMSGVEKAPGSAEKSRKRHIVFFGDSTVIGVGCSEEAGSNGPVMPRSCASLIAKEIGEDICWTVMGETGADVKVLQNHWLPSFERLTEQLHAVGEHVDVVVVLCGLNDVKECCLHARPLTRNPVEFRNNLEDLLVSLRKAAGRHCTLLVPEEPMGESPRFAKLWPLSSAVRLVAFLWDSQKREACVRLAHRDPISKPAETRLMFSSTVAHLQMPTVMRPTFYCADGMHPNDHGYQAWGEVLAGRLLANLASVTCTCYVPAIHESVEVIMTT